MILFYKFFPCYWDLIDLKFLHYLSLHIKRIQKVNYYLKKCQNAPNIIK